MNRHTRRAAVAKNKRLVASLAEISGTAEKLQPFLGQINALQEQLEHALGLLAQTRADNESLMKALNVQQAVYYRLFAQGMGVSLDSVLSMVVAIQAQLMEGNTDGIETTETPEPEPEDHSGTRT